MKYYKNILLLFAVFGYSLSVNLFSQEELIGNLHFKIVLNKSKIIFGEPLLITCLIKNASDSEFWHENTKERYPYDPFILGFIVETSGKSKHIGFHFAEAMLNLNRHREPYFYEEDGLTNEKVYIKPFEEVIIQSIIYNKDTGDLRFEHPGDYKIKAYINFIFGKKVVKLETVNEEKVELIKPSTRQEVEITNYFNGSAAEVLLGGIVSGLPDDQSNLKKLIESDLEGKLSNYLYYLLARSYLMKDEKQRTPDDLQRAVICYKKILKHKDFQFLGHSYRELAMCYDLISIRASKEKEKYAVLAKDIKEEWKSVMPNDYARNVLESHWVFKFSDLNSKIDYCPEPNLPFENIEDLLNEIKDPNEAKTNSDTSNPQITDPLITGSDDPAQSNPAGKKSPKKNKSDKIINQDFLMFSTIIIILLFSIFLVRKLLRKQA